MSNQFTFFWHETSPFSQFYPARFVVDNKQFNCAEQFMMYSKAITFEDSETAKLILEETKPEKQKKLGRMVKNFDADKWSTISEQVVYQGNYAKFTQNEDLLKELFKTQNTELAETSPTDTIWGIGLPENSPKIYDKSKWRGQNKLGVVLTKLRNDLIKEPKYKVLIMNSQK